MMGHNVNDYTTTLNYNTFEELGKWFMPSQRKPEVKSIEYVFKNELNYLKQIVDKHDVDIVHCLQAIDVNRNDCEQMYRAIDILKRDMQSIEQLANYLYDKVESAPSVTKRKHKVTICANGQRVEVCR